MSKMIGLTGGIGAGKTMVAKIFENLGVPVFNADDTAKQLMQTSPEIKTALIQQFGEKVYEKGILQKAYLSSIVFSDADQLALLNSIVHPITIQAAWDWAKLQTAPYVIKEAALLFESNAVEGLDFVIGVTAPTSLRIQRIMQRDNCTKQAAEKRMLNQISDTIKMRLCDKVIVNDEIQLLTPQALAIHEFILASVI
ncbi:MAG: dephospho-CoA kinase [Sediminibacterium sp.]|nr:MAG: dephospho-CoA kinase [Sediminibacterium sp.]